MKLVKTDKARAELQPGVRTLGQRERSLLLLVDRHQSLREISKILGGDLESLANALVESGHLAHMFPPTQSAPVVLAPVPQLTSTDQFEGKRSLATTRMFLFDICERMFSRTNPDLANVFRNDLRDAKDRESMLSVGREMIAEIERVAGADRADSISERIAMMLPVQEPSASTA